MRRNDFTGTDFISSDDVKPPLGLNLLIKGKDERPIRGIRQNLVYDNDDLILVPDAVVEDLDDGHFELDTVFEEEEDELAV